jgi:hypothetical protein
MAAHASNWGDLLNLHHRKGKQHTMVMMFVRGVVLVVDGIPVLFLLQESHEGGVFCSRLNLDRGKDVYAPKTKKSFQYMN